MQDALQLLKSFCESYFVKKDVEAALSLLTRDILWMDTSGRGDAHTLDEVRARMEKAIAGWPEGYALQYAEENCVGAGPQTDVGVLTVRFSSGDLSFLRRICACSRMENGESRLCMLHISAPGDASSSEENRMSGAFFKDTQAQLENLVSAIPGGVAKYRLRDGRLEMLYRSTGLESPDGTAPDEYRVLREKGLEGAIYKDDRPVLQNAIERALSSSRTVSIAYRIPREDGSNIWTAVSLRCTGTEDGCPILHAVFTPLTYQSQLYRTIAAESGSGIVVVDRHSYELLYCNRAATDIMHIPDSGHAGKKCYECFFGSDEPCAFCQAPKFRRGAIESVPLHLEKDDRHLSIRGTIIDWAGHEAVVEYIDDVTEVYKSRAQIDELLENTSCGLAICDVDTEGRFHIRYLNDEFFAICENERGALTQRFDEELLTGIHPNDRAMVQNKLDAAIRDKRDYELTYRFMTDGGRYKWLSARTKILPHADGTLTTYSTYFDVTEQMRLQQQFSDVIHTVPGGICQFRWDGKRLQPLLVNAQLTEMFGEDALGYLDGTEDMNYSHVHPEDLEELKSVLRAALKQGRDIDHSYRSLSLKTNDYRWVRIRGTMRPEPDGTHHVYISYNDVTQEHLAEQRLRENEQMLEFAARYAGLWYWRYDTANARAYLDRKNLQDTVLPEVLDDYPEIWLRQGYIHPDHIETYRDACRRIAAGEDEVVFEAQTRLPDNNWHWARFRFTNLFDVHGKTPNAICTGIVIDAEKALLAQYELEKKKPSLGEENLIAHALFNLTNGKVLEYAYRDGSEVPLEDRLLFADEYGNADRLIVDEGERQRFRELNDIPSLLERFAQGESEFKIDYRCKMPDGSVRWFRNLLHMVRDPAGSDILLFEYRYDVDEEINLQMLYRSLANDNYDYVAQVNARNGSLRQLLRDGHGAREDGGAEAVARQLCAENVHPEDREALLRHTSLDGLKEVLKTRDRFQFIYREPQPDESLRYKRLTAYYLDRQREIIIVTREDITALIREETEKNQALADALTAANLASQAKTQFLSRMSHELRTPMNAIIGLSALAAGDIENPAVMADTVGKIGLSARYLLSLINDILEMSRIESGRMTLNESAFGFPELVSSVNNIIYGQAADKGVDYDAIVSGFTESVYIGDATKLQQILINVLGNAVKFTPAGGKITLAIEQFRQASGRALLRFTISDTGVGIDEAFLPHLFDAFAQEDTHYVTSSLGTGLGLAITKNMVDMMGGQIHVQSIKNIGSVFTIELPLGVSEESRRQHELFASMNLSSLSALVVDDDVVVCQSTERILASMGVQAEWTDSGRGAIDCVTKAHATGRDYDTVFIDWKMPDMDGIETTREIRRIVGPDVTIVIMTAYDWRSVEEQARAAGVDMFMEKPLFQSSILTVFESIFSARNMQAAVTSPTLKHDLSGRRILLAEDHPLNVEVAKRLLEKAGAEVAVAGNGLEALEAFTTAETGWFDAILMDIRMPVMDGLIAAKSIRNLKKGGSRDIPIVAMTANAFDEDVELSLANGMNAHLSKPIEPSRLYATLERLMASGK